jgi:hypothetical protein
MKEMLNALKICNQPKMKNNSPLPARFLLQEELLTQQLHKKPAELIK